MDQILVHLGQSANILDGKVYKGDYDMLAQFYIKNREDLIASNAILGQLVVPINPIIKNGRRAQLVHGLRTHPTILRTNVEMLKLNIPDLYNTSVDDLVVAILSKTDRIYDGLADYDTRIQNIRNTINASPKPTTATATTVKTTTTATTAATSTGNTIYVAVANK